MTRTLSTLRLTSGITVHNHVCILVQDSLNTCSGMRVHLCDSPEHFMELPM